MKYTGCQNGVRMPLTSRASGAIEAEEEGLRVLVVQRAEGLEGADLKSTGSAQKSQVGAVV